MNDNFVNQLTNKFKKYSYNDIMNLLSIRDRSKVKPYIDDLVNKGIIEVRNNKPRVLGGKIKGIANEYRIPIPVKEDETLNDIVRSSGGPSSAVCLEDKSIIEGKLVKFRYKGFKDVEELITREDKILARSIFEEYGEETLYTNECINKGMSREKAWFLYDKLTIKKMTNELFK